MTPFLFYVVQGGLLFMKIREITASIKIILRFR